MLHTEPSYHILSLCVVISNKFPRLLAEREIIANAFLKSGFLPEPVAKVQKSLELYVVVGKKMKIWPKILEENRKRGCLYIIMFRHTGVRMGNTSCMSEATPEDKIAYSRMHKVFELIASMKTEETDESGKNDLLGSGGPGRGGVSIEKTKSEY